MAFGGLDIGSSGVKCAFSMKGKTQPLPDRIMIIVPIWGIMDWMAGLSGIR